MIPERENWHSKHVQGVTNKVADMLSRINPDISVQDVRLKGKDNKADPSEVSVLNPPSPDEGCAPSVNLCTDLSAGDTSSRLSGILPESVTTAKFPRTVSQFLYDIHADNMQFLIMTVVLIL